MEYITKFLPFEQIMTKNLNTDMELIGYGNVYGLPDLVGDVVMRNAFDESLSAHMTAKTMPQMLFEHKKGAVCGEWTEVKEDEYGLYLKGVVKHKIASNVIEKIHKGKITGLSIGFNIVKAENRRGLRYIVKGILHEISLVGTPANQYSRFMPTNIDVEHSRESARMFSRG